MDFDEIWKLQASFRPTLVPHSLLSNSYRRLLPQGKAAGVWS